MVSTLIQPACADDPTGSITVTPSGGIAPYSYLWSNSGTTQTLTNVQGGSYTVTITDSKGCTGTATGTLLPLDNVAPTVMCPVSIAFPASAGMCNAVINGIDATFGDNCPNPVLSYASTGATTLAGTGQASGQVFNVGITTVTYTVTDVGKNSSCSFTVTITDNQLPTASNPPTLPGIKCLADVPLPDPAVVTDEADNCPGVIVAYVSESNNGGTGCLASPLIITRTYRVTDASMNSITVVHQIEVADDVAPVLDAPPAAITVECSAIPPVAVLTATDNCTVVPVTVTVDSMDTGGSCTHGFIRTRTWTATDACGNTATVSQVITVQDMTDPIISCTDPVTPINCPAPPVFIDATATDNCDAMVTVTFADDDTPACGNTFGRTRTWTATDDCGNTATCSRTIVVQDLTNPTITCADQITPIACPNTPVWAPPTAMDACDVMVAITFTDDTSPGGCAGAFSTTRTWTATDDCGNTATCSRTIVVQDITAPAINCAPQTSPIACPATPVWAVASATDACDPMVAITFNDDTTPGSCAGTYTTVRTWTATDDCGNTATCSRTVVVQDVTVPEIICATQVTPVDCPATPVWVAPTVSDACDMTVAVTFADAPDVVGTCPGTYSRTRTWTATDDCGNTATCSRTIVVQDVTNPIITCPGNLTLECDLNYAAEISAWLGTASATDVCDLTPTITNNYDGSTVPPVSCNLVSGLTVTFTATDDCNNTAVCTSTIYIDDSQAPSITCPANLVLDCDGDYSVEINTWLVSVTGSDACGNTTLVYTNNYTNGTLPMLSCDVSGGLVVTFTVTDACANSTQCTSTVYIDDTQMPSITCPANLTLECDGNYAAEISTWLSTATAMDACDLFPIITNNYDGSTVPAVSCNLSGGLMVTFTAMDDCSNTAVCTSTIFIDDSQVPTITCPANLTLECDGDYATEINTWLGTASATDVVTCRRRFRTTTTDLHCLP